MVKLKVFFETFGCTSNQADTEIMKGLVQGPHMIVTDLEDCEVVVINSCGVIEHTQRKVIKSARKAASEGKKVVLAGCLSKIDPDSIAESGADSTIAPDSLDLINQALDAALNGGSIISSSQPVDKSFLRIAEGQIIVAIPIAEGCLGSCSYCATRNARGRLRSFNADAIKDTITRAIAKGTKEIQLTAQDTGIYGMDIGSSLPNLINEICEIEGDFRVRAGMMNPAHVYPILDDLIEAYQDEKVYKFLHLPLQSGDDEILEQMHRGYKVRDFTAIVARFREAFSELTLSTDVIIGYQQG
jgi:MiaB-like tRNA modifying enzyme